MIGILPHTFKPRFEENVPNEVYHSDKTAVSSSALRTILKSPATFLHNLNSFKKETVAMRLGSVLHMALLEPKEFERLYVKQPYFGDQRTPANRMKKEEWFKTLPQGAVTVSDDEYQTILGMIESIMRHHEACALLKTGKAEMSGYYRDPLTGIHCRIRPDLFDEKDGVLIDVKTTPNCSIEEFSKTIHKYRYDFQMAMYCEAIHLITGKPVNVPLFLTVEKEPPFEVALYPVDSLSKLLRKGTYDYQKALVTLHHCLKTNQWLPYQSQMQPIDLPVWVKEEEFLI